MRNDKGLGANVQSGLSERMRISETPEKLGMAHTNERTQKPKGGTVEKASYKK